MQTHRLELVLASSLAVTLAACAAQVASSPASSAPAAQASPPVADVPSAAAPGEPAAATTTTPAPQSAPAPVAALPADPPPPADGRYEIVLHRPGVVGRAVRFSARGEKVTKQRRTLPRQPTTDGTERLAIRVSGVHRTLEVDETGDIVRAEVTVEQCVAESSGAPEVLIPPGASLVIESARRPARGRYLVNGSEPSQRVRDHLAVVFSTSRSVGNDDQVFGSPGRPRRERESWSVQAAPMVQEFAEVFPAMTERDVRGRVTFHALQQEGDRAFLDIGADVTLRIRQMAGLPAGTRLDQGTMRVQLRALFPRSLGVHSPRERTEMTSRMRMRIPSPGGQVRLDMDIDEWREVTRSPL